MDTHRSRTSETPEQEQFHFDAGVSMLTYVLDRMQRLGWSFKIVGIGRIRVGTDADSLKGSVLVCGKLQPSYDHLCGKG